MCHLHKAAGGSRGSPHFDGSDGQKHGTCRKIAGKLSIHQQIARFSRFCWFPAISTSPTENWCLVCCYQILLIKCAIYIRPQVDFGVRPISTAPMARNTENPRFSWKTARKRSIHRQIARFSRFCGFPAISTSPTENFLLPNSAYKMCHSHKACRRKEKIDVSLALNPKGSRSGRLRRLMNGAGWEKIEQPARHEPAEEQPLLQARRPPQDPHKH